MGRSTPDEAVIASRTTGVAVAAALLVANASNYAFQVITGRNLSVEEYGTLAGYMAALTVITVAASALQTTSARAIAADEVDPSGPRFFDQLTRTTFRVAAIAAICALVLAPAIRRTLDFGIVATVILGLYAFPAALDSISAGRLQGARRFKALAAYSASQALAKLATVVVGLMIGLSVTALVGVVVISSMVVATIGRWSSASAGAVRAHALGRESRTAFAAFTVFWLILSMDVPLARIRFDGTEAGIYAAGAVLGKAVIWIPVTIAQLVFPALANRGAAGQDTARVFRKASRLTLVIAVSSVAVLVLFGPMLYRILYGERYVGAADVAWKLGVAMIPLAFVNLLMFERLAQRSGRFVLVLVAAAAAQSAALCLVPSSATWFAVTIGLVGLALMLLLASTSRRSVALQVSPS